MQISDLPSANDSKVNFTATCQRFLASLFELNNVYFSIVVSICIFRRTAKKCLELDRVITIRNCTRPRTMQRMFETSTISDMLYTERRFDRGQEMVLTSSVTFLQRGWTPLIMAAKGGYTEVVDCLLEREPHINVTDQV